MFDAETSLLLRSAPALPNLDPNDIPRILTSHYAQLVSARLSGTAAGDDAEAVQGWTLEKIADTYELLTSIHGDPAIRRAAAFVSAANIFWHVRRMTGLMLRLVMLIVTGLIYLLRPPSCSSQQNNTLMQMKPPPLSSPNVITNYTKPLYSLSTFVILLGVILQKYLAELPVGDKRNGALLVWRNGPLLL